MPELKIINQKGVLVVDSRLVAARLRVDHHNFSQTITKYKTVIEEAFGSLLFQTEVRKSGTGNAPKFVYLTEDQATFLMTLSRNTPQVVQCKIDLVKSFSAAKELIKSNSHAGGSASVYRIEHYISSRIAPQKESQMFSKEWIDAAVAMNGFPWGDPRMGQFIFDSVWAYHPKPVVSELREVNPRRNSGRGRVRTHTQHLTQGAKTSTQVHISNVLAYMKLTLKEPCKDRRLELFSSFMGTAFGAFKLTPVDPDQLLLLEVRRSVEFILPEDRVG